MTFREAVEAIKEHEQSCAAMADYYDGTIYGDSYADQARGLRYSLAFLDRVKEPGISACGTATTDRFQEVMRAGEQSKLS